MIVLVCGSRTWEDVWTIQDALCGLQVEHDADLEIIHGGANGADRFADEICRDYGIRQRVFRPNWNKYGKRAGIVRNRQMLDEEPDLVLAFTNGTAGTQYTIDSARGREIPVIVVGRERST